MYLIGSEEEYTVEKLSRFKTCKDINCLQRVINMQDCSMFKEQRFKVLLTERSKTNTNKATYKGFNFLF